MLWQEGFSLETKYIKSCGTIMADLIQVPQGKYVYTQTNVLSAHTHTYHSCAHRPSYTFTPVHSDSNAQHLHTHLTQTGTYHCLCVHGFTQPVHVCVHTQITYMHIDTHSTYTPITHAHRLTPLLMCTYIHITHILSCSHTHITHCQSCTYMSSTYMHTQTCGSFV